MIKRAFVGSSLFLMTGAILPLWRAQEQTGLAPKGGDSLVHIANILIAAGTALLVLTHWSRVRTILRSNRLIWLFVVLAVASASWAFNQSFSISRSLMLVAATGLGAYVSTCLTWEDSLRLASRVLAVAAIASLAAVVFLPQHAVVRNFNEEAWRGVFIHKNTLGLIMALAALVFFVRALEARRGRTACLLGGALSTVLVVKSDSKSAIVVLSLIVCCAPSLRLLRRSRWIVAPIGAALLIGVLGAVYVSGQSELVASGLGRDETLTGRTRLWSSVWSVVMDRPLLGYGNGSFWLESGGPSRPVMREVGFQPWSAHNGYLDVAVHLGFVGLTLFLAAFCVTAWNAVRLARHGDRVVTLWPLVLLLFLAIYDMAETVIARPEGQIYWVLFVAAAVSTTGMRTRQSLIPTERTLGYRGAAAIASRSRQHPAAIVLRSAP